MSTILQAWGLVVFAFLLGAAIGWRAATELVDRLQRRIGRLEALQREATLRLAAADEALEAVCCGGAALDEQWSIAHADRCTNMRDCTSFGGPKQCHHPRPTCFGSNPGAQARAENDCDCCSHRSACGAAASAVTLTRHH